MELLKIRKKNRKKSGQGGNRTRESERKDCVNPKLGSIRRKSNQTRTALSSRQLKLYSLSTFSHNRCFIFHIHPVPFLPFIFKFWYKKWPKDKKRHFFILALKFLVLIKVTFSDIYEINRTRCAFGTEIQFLVRLVK